MATSVIDTLRYAMRLKKAGVPSEKAEVMADALAVELDSNLVTKADLGSAVLELKAGFKAEIAALEARLIWRFLGGVTVIFGLAVTLTATLIRFG